MRHNTVLSKWQLKNMFDALAPANEKVRSKLFVGRQQELGDILDHISSRDRAILIYGFYGVGKTMVMREALSRLKELPKSQFVTAYTNYNADLGLKYCALVAIAEELVALFGNETAKETLHLLTRGGIIEGQKKSISYSSAEVKNVDGALRDLRREVEREIEGCRVVIAIDDIERRADVALVQDMIDDIRALRDYEYSIIIPGHPVNATKALYSGASGILLPIELKQLETTELIGVMKSHLKLGRSESSCIDNPELYPFLPEVANLIAKRFSSPDNTVREFVVACFHILEEGAKICDEYIEPEQLAQIWPLIGPRILAAVDNHDHAIRMLRIIQEQGGVITEDVDYEVINHILSGPGGYEDAINELRRLIESTLLIEAHDGYKRSVKFNQRVLDQDVLNTILKNPPTDIPFNTHL